MGPGARGPRRREAVLEWLGRPSTVIAFLLVLLGLGFIGLEAQSHTRLYWTGDQTSGVVEGDIVYYRVDGVNYTVHDTGPVHADGTELTVYVDPREPSRAILEGPAKWLTAVAVAACFLAALLVLVLAPTRRRWQRRHREPDPRMDAHW